MTDAYALHVSPNNVSPFNPRCQNDQRTSFVTNARPYSDSQPNAEAAAGCETPASLTQDDRHRLARSRRHLLPVHVQSVGELLRGTRLGYSLNARCSAARTDLDARQG